MSTRSRAYRATHQPDGALHSVIPEFHAVAEERGKLDQAAVAELARRVSLPVAAVRGAVSSYDDSNVNPNAIRVCTGTSCVLSGGGEVLRELQKHYPCHGTYCLGYCDRGPAAMTADGYIVPNLPMAMVNVFAQGGPLPHPAPPSIRTVSRHAIVNARIEKSIDPRGAAPEYTGLRAALKLTPEQVVEAVLTSGLRGRGGAAFPTGKKFQLAARASGSPKFIVANGDEGDPGSFIDRELMERDPHSIIEGMAIAGHAVGASRGIVFIRSEYPVSVDVINTAIKRATDAGFLGKDALGKGKAFDIEVVRGMGSYVCGEETALLGAIEGMRGEVWPRPPYPIESGVFGRPTVVDNVETLNNLPWIMEHGAAAFASMGTADSKGTKALCFNKGFARPGIVEIEFGMSLGDAIEKLAGGGAGGVELEAVLVGGPMGSIVTPDQWDAPICFTAMVKRGINLGHAGIVAIPKPADWGAMLKHLLAFMRDESCGKCVPCRLGSTRAYEMAMGGLSRRDLPNFERILALMKEASLCAFGRETPGPVKTILERFGDRIFSEGGR
ncbi:MAG: NAD(P)H-dependent oxidoreductase subunit E [Phycisphaerales bacterium]|jgi:NADH:ubiquinone oxidoreductase subunit F (NADH-binding)/NADH:ubiquinone oxidoreductase subunit E|nr:NAD(P)H-dependent oxidoreductase subunit E [Phycisphaerales bacterium]